MTGSSRAKNPRYNTRRLRDTVKDLSTENHSMSLPYSRCTHKVLFHTQLLSSKFMSIYHLHAFVKMLTVVQYVHSVSLFVVKNCNHVRENDEPLCGTKGRREYHFEDSKRPQFWGEGAQGVQTFNDCQTFNMVQVKKWIWSRICHEEG